MACFVKASPEFDQWAAGRPRAERSAHLDIGRLALDPMRLATAGHRGTVVASRRGGASGGQVARTQLRALADTGDLSATPSARTRVQGYVRVRLDAPVDDAVSGFRRGARRGEVRGQTAGAPDAGVGLAWCR
jgi:hypothetical protein